MTRSEKAYLALLVVAGVVFLATVIIGLTTGRVSSVQRSIASLLLVGGAPLLAVWLFRGPEGARYLVILGVLVAADATSTYLLQLQDEMFVVREWLWMLILFGSAGFVWWRKRRAEPPE